MSDQHMGGNTRPSIKYIYIEAIMLIIAYIRLASQTVDQTEC